MKTLYRKPENLGLFNINFFYGFSVTLLFFILIILPIKSASDLKGKFIFNFINFIIMKKLLFGLIATVLLSVSVNAQSKSYYLVGQPFPTPKTVGLFSATNGCWGWGFCNASAPWENASQIGTTIQTLNINNTMTFKIRLGTMNAENVKFYTGKTTFELKDNSPLQAGECTLFGIKPGAKYLAGVYPLVNDGTYITFTVKFE